METFTKLFGSLLVFVYHCFDRIVIRGYLSGVSRPAAHRRLPEVGGSLCPQSHDSRPMGREGRAQGRLRAASPAPDGEEECVWSLLRLQEHGARFHIPLQRSQVPHPRPELSHSGSSAEPLHALLLLCPRESSRADGNSRGLLFSFPDHLLSQRPLVHGTGAESAQYRLSQT